MRRWTGSGELGKGFKGKRKGLSKRRRGRRRDERGLSGAGKNIIIFYINDVTFFTLKMDPYFEGKRGRSLSAALQAAYL